MYYCVKKVGETRVPEKPYLMYTMMGYCWAGKSYAYKFDSLDFANQARKDLIKDGFNVFIEWNDESKNPKCGAFGEVNSIALEKKL